MASPQVLINTIPRHLQILKNSCGWWGSSKLTELISKSEKLIQDSQKRPKSLNLSEVSVPFLFAAETDAMKFRPITLDYFADIFSLSSNSFFPSYQLTEKALAFTCRDYDTATNEDRMKTCRTVSAILNSNSSTYFIHGNALLKVYTFMLSLHNKAKGTPAAEVCQMTISDTIRHILGYYGKPSYIPQYAKVKFTVTFFTQCAVRNAVTIADVFPKMSKNYPLTIFDADAVSILRAFAGILANELTKSNNTLNSDINQNSNDQNNSKNNSQIVQSCIPTLELCCSMLDEILNLNIPLFCEGPIIENILNREIHLAMMALALDNHIELSIPFAKLILTVYQKFSHIYIHRIHDLFDKGLLHTLSSPSSRQISRTCEVLKYLASAPQLFVDLFVNFDCDSSGTYVSLFENTISLVAKHAYPDDSSQLPALKVLRKILKTLWKYLNTTKSNKAEIVTDTLIEAKRQKDVFQQGVDLFKKEPKKGLRYFIQQNITTQEKAAEFLFNTQQLDPKGVGEIIGTLNNSEILKNYVAFFDFKNKGFEEAFRMFLSKFRIPGEGQMIDRVMEEFGSKYYNDNPGVFSTADTVYVVAYSALMLYTDAHHPKLSSRMSLDEFIANNRGIDGGKDLPRQFLVDLYDGITTKEIQLLSKEDVPSLLTRKQKAELYLQRCNRILANAKQAASTSTSLTYKKVGSADIVSPMFQIVWPPVLAVFAISFDSSENNKIIKCSLRGLTYASHIASHCYCEEALETLVSSFTKFTKLRTYGVEEIKEKNIKCTQELLSVATTDRNFLRGAWALLMDEVSALQKLKYFTIPDILFTGSDSLDRESINDLVSAMCQTSANELSENPPRMYTLLRLADVAYFNMGRPKIIWKEIWETISAQIIEAGSSENADIAKATINVLWQITKKFIEQPETNAFHFQEHFLRPFFEIFIVQQSPEVKGMIIECTTSLVNELANSLHSGWSVVFQILNACAIDYRVKGYELISKIINEHLVDLSHPQVVHLQSVLTSFVVKGKTPKIGAKAVLLFEKIASFLSQNNANDEVWGCFFASLQKCIMNPTPIIKKRSVLSTVEIMQKEKVSDIVKETILNELIPDVFNLFVEPEMTNLLTEIMDISIRLDLKMNILMQCCLHENSDFSLNSLTLLASFFQQNSKEIEEKLGNELSADIDKLCGLKRVELIIFFSKTLKTFENNGKMTDKILSSIRKCTEKEANEIGLFECSMEQLYVEQLMNMKKVKMATKSVTTFLSKIEGNEELKDFSESLSKMIKK